jgi:diguanylate cyclase (GGDEF)-like protein
MDRILVVEDTQFFSSIIRKRLQREFGMEVVCATSMAEAVALVEERNDFCLNLLDLNLPDAPNGEIAEYFAEMNLPSIIFTGSYHPGLRDRIYDMGIIDYVIKESPASIDYLVAMVGRVMRNRQITALVVDDSKTSRMHITAQLKRFQLRVLEAEDGEDALRVMEQEEDDIRLVITDYDMPVMDGFGLIKALRKTRPKTELAIIGLSASGSRDISARFIKTGANDFITKPFQPEEFLCRISQNLDNLDLIDSLRNAATRDYLTGLHNRRFFFEAARPIFAQAERGDRSIALMMFDIDHFKKVNDSYGHDAGDAVLVEIADSLSQRTRDSDLLARFGGEEFCLLLVDADPDALPNIARDYLARVAGLSIEVRGHKLQVTVSAGLCCDKTSTLEDMIAAADRLLYAAKDAGRNRTMISCTLTAEVVEVPGPPSGLMGTAHSDNAN